MFGFGQKNAHQPKLALAIRRKQTLIAAGLLAAAGLGLAGLFMAMRSKAPDTAPAQPAKPIPMTQITPPGAQTDPKDVWRGQEGARIDRLEQQIAELNDQLRRSNAQGATQPAFPPGQPTPPIPAPPPPPPTLQTSLPPPPPPQARTLAQAQPGAPQEQPPVLGIESGEMGEAPTKDKNVPEDKRPDAATKRADTYLPSGSFVRAVLLSGLNAPTGGQAQSNPHPVLMRVLDHAQLPNQFRLRAKNCLIVGTGYGDLSSERAFIRTESISCISSTGEALDMPIKGYVAGEDGKFGVMGRLVTKQGQVLANALIAGIGSGLGQAFQQSSMITSTSALGSTQTVKDGQELRAGLASGVGKAMDRLAQYYISLAEKLYPVIEVDAGRVVDVVITKGTTLPMGAAGSGIPETDRRYGVR